MNNYLLHFKYWDSKQWIEKTILIQCDKLELLKKTQEELGKYPYYYLENITKIND